MSEIKNVQKIIFSLEKQKGLYTGQALCGVVRSIPEGYGKLVLIDGTIIDGHFKEGNFVSGKAKTKEGVVLEGDFDNMKWLSGKITYPNGDYITGKIGLSTQKLEIDEFRLTQEFGDVIEGKCIDKNGKNVLTGVQTLVDGSTFNGVFVESKTITHADFLETKFYEKASFGIKKPFLKCYEAKANLNIFKDKEDASIHAEFVGNFLDGQLEGKFFLTQGEFKQTLSGSFDYERESTKLSKHNRISEDFGNFFKTTEAQASFFYGLDLKKGTVLMVDGAESFKAEKHIDKNEIITYNGTFLSAKYNQTIVGDFFEDLSIKSVEVNSETRVNKIVGKVDYDDSKQNYSFVGEATSFSGDYKKGKFVSEVVFEKNENGMPKQLLMKNRFLSGEFRQTIKNIDFDSFVFEGKTRDQITREDSKDFDILKAPYIFDKQNERISFLGTLVGTFEDEEVVNKHGLFDSNFNLLEGTVQDFVKIDGKTLWTNGNKKFNSKKEEIFSGRAIFEENEDWFDGVFSADYEFISGNFKKTLENGSIFTAETKDQKNFVGKLERAGDFWQEGEFKKTEEGDFEFQRGKTEVYFDREDKAKCFANYDKNGFADYDGKTYICVVKTNIKRPVVDIFATDSIVDAMVQYDHKIQNEKLAKTSDNGRKQVENIVKNAEKASKTTVEENNTKNNSFTN